jgi:hypothetical protein
LHGRVKATSGEGPLPNRKSRPIAQLGAGAKNVSAYS